MMMASAKKYVNTRLSSVIRHAGLPRKLVAYLADIPLETFNNYYYGRHVPRCDYAMRIAHVLNRRVEDIWGLPMAIVRDMDSRTACSAVWSALAAFNVRTRPRSRRMWIGTDSLTLEQRAWITGKESNDESTARQIQ